MATEKVIAELKKRMEKKNIKPAELSRLANINPATLYNFMSGKSGITTTTLDKLDKILESK